jgi:HEAT repeat protein
MPQTPFQHSSSPCATRTTSAGFGLLLHSCLSGQLVKTLESDENQYVREEIVRALGRIGTADAVAALIGTLTDRSNDVRWEAAIGLKMLGRKAKKAREALQNLMIIESDENIRSQAEAALRRMKNV